MLTQTLGTTWTGMAWMSARHVERRQSFGLVTPTGLMNETLSTRESGNDIGLKVEVVPDMPIVPLIHFRDTARCSAREHG